ncbi:MAG: carboxypeptidase regulatory-like domain-containing protein [Opitutaceae bacterium]
MQALEPIRNLPAAARRLIARVGLLCIFACSPVFSSVRAADTAGTISGTVSNAATGNLLEGAKISLPLLNLSAFTDNSGRYVMTGVPAGTHAPPRAWSGVTPISSPRSARSPPRRST